MEGLLGAKAQRQGLGSASGRSCWGLGTQGGLKEPETPCVQSPGLRRDRDRVDGTQHVLPSPPAGGDAL